MNRSFLPARLRHLPFALPLSLVIALGAWLLAAQPGRCDRVILTPTGTALMEKSESGEFLQSIQDAPQTALWANAGLSRLEIEGAYFHRAGRDAYGLSLETPIFPETFLTPAVAVGVRDVLNTTRDVRGLGYGGRDYYIAATKSYPSSQPNAPIRDIVVTGGLGGGGSLHGVFGSVTAEIPFHLQGAFEYDGSRANFRVALPTSRISRLEYTRIGHEGFVGFQLNSPVSF